MIIFLTVIPSCSPRILLTKDVPEVVGGGPVIPVSSEPFTVDDETFGKTVDERIGHSLGETSEEMKTCTTK